MVARDLLRELEGRGVRLAVQDGRLVARGPQGAVTPELAAQIGAQKDALLRELQAGTGGSLALLPEALVRLVRAAASNHLNRSGFLPDGIVPNLGEYVLACASLYACGFEPERQLAGLWAARRVWGA
ncbi:hypothetical protein DEIPH_ctg021orf0078 [Deinococcus phoenicis]|uniref:TubC N-terminal docking domain-containing protein n=1 Tax=Deinococcus phoenicis TaxID=1476583 RepID=A0A016QS37_9DEIO|nr:hypothetical protein [Deinococcus phoenicis]EYB68559.1 hypothetical protein DEIPH_ctg021orf0078 [Deinococcus phoenicis]